MTKNKLTIVARCKEGQVMYYFNARLAKLEEVNAIERTMEINEAHNKMAHIGEEAL